MASVRKISLWTESLNEEWNHDSQNRQRIDRGAEAFTEIPATIDRIRNLNGPDLECLLILQANRKNLEITVHQNGIQISNPQDPNYQNVSISENALTEFIDHYFSLTTDEATHHFLPLLIVRFAFFALFLSIVSGILIFLYILLLSESGFFPEVKVTEIEDVAERQQLTTAYAGIYATRIGEGAMVIELRQDGEFSYYDMRKYGPGKFRLDKVTEGSWRPAYEGVQIALVTGVRYVFYAEGKERILFLERPFDLVGRGPEDVPYLAFPDR